MGIVIGLGVWFLILNLDRHFSQAESRAQIALARARLHVIVLSLDLFCLSEGELPLTLDQLALPSHADGVVLLDPIPSDPWGRPYIYELIDSDGYVLRTYGEDGVVGGSGASADIEFRSP